MALVDQDCDPVNAMCTKCATSARWLHPQQRCWTRCRYDRSRGHHWGSIEYRSFVQANCEYAAGKSFPTLWCRRNCPFILHVVHDQWALDSRQNFDLNSKRVAIADHSYGIQEGEFRGSLRGEADCNRDTKVVKRFARWPVQTVEFQTKVKSACSAALGSMRRKQDSPAQLHRVRRYQTLQHTL
jgi:hypothetical protein